MYYIELYIEIKHFKHWIARWNTSSLEYFRN